MQHINHTKKEKENQMKKKKQFLALLLAVVLFLSGIWTGLPTADGLSKERAKEQHVTTVTAAVPSNGQITLAEPAKEEAVGGFATSENAEGGTETESSERKTADDRHSRIVSDGGERISEQKEAVRPEEDTLVDLIVVMKKKALLDMFSEEEIDADGSAVQKYRSVQKNTVEKLTRSLEDKFGEEQDFEIGYTYTAAMTGVSVKTRYGNKKAIEELPGVDYVYTAPVYKIQEQTQEEIRMQTANASGMIGATQLNSTGYTGKGMRIAIIDTGIVVNHPSFQALPESKLTDTSLTEAEVAGVWKSLNAGKTPLRNAAYQNSKIPFAFNYTTMDFDVSHTTAQHDHGTHVAGIAAANKTDTSNVVGIAPDAQLIVMQVFERSGGASWATILAALEDCTRLNVDTVNLSLGSPAGFTDNEKEMTDTLQKFKNMDIQMIVAAGNETNTGYMNKTGTNMAKKENPDHGLIASPATASVAMSVASVDNDGADQLYFTLDGDTSAKIGFQDTAVSGYTNFYQKFKGQTKEFAVIDGIGSAEDYRVSGIDVQGKIAVVERGTISFQEKQKAAKDAGAIAVIVSNNVQGAFSMAISDGAGYIPCIGVSLADGQKLKQKQSGTLTVCTGDLVHVSMGRAMSSFSSWGVTPDLKLKPEISGVGGGIYSTRDPEIAGSDYGDMSGTSMASPQVAGAVTVLTQYLKDSHADAYSSETELRRVAANLMMSTAEQIRYNDLEASPRNQGAGLVNLTNAVKAEAYLSAPDTYDTRPKGEMGDDDNKTGKFRFRFSVTNMAAAAQTYSFDSVVMTPDVSEEKYMTDTPRKLNAKVQVTGSSMHGSTLTVQPGQTAELTAELSLSAEDKNFIERNFTKGIYIEGYLYAKNTDSQKTGLSMPFLGFYGDWSGTGGPKVFDEAGSEASFRAPTIKTNRSVLGENPYYKGGKSGDKYNAVSTANPLAELTFGLLRNAKKIDTKVTDISNGKTYFNWSENYITKSYFNSSYGMIIPYSIYNFNNEIAVWDVANAANNAKVTYRVDAYLDDGDNIADDSYTFQVTVDNSKPEIINKNTLASGIIKDTEKGTVKMPVTLKDNQYLAAVLFESPDGTVLGRFEVDNMPGEEVQQVFDVTGFGTDFTVIAADYACNETEVAVSLDLSDMPGNGQAEPRKLDQDRIYGNETFDGGVVSTGWFSGKKADFTDLKNETYDSSIRYYSGEYVNGYVIAQRATDGAVVMLTPYNTWWSSRTLLTQYGAVGTAGFKVLYDMALDYSQDRLYAVGWDYAGDTDGDGKDNGSNALFELKFNQTDNAVSLEKVADISGLEDGKEALTLGCTTDGNMYVISTDGKLYQLDKATGQGTYRGTTDFVKKADYSGVNVIQSMGYDHNTDKMYWFAHSQTASGYMYINVCATYTVDLENGSCTEVGSAGAADIHRCLYQRRKNQNYSI